MTRKEKKRELLTKELRSDMNDLDLSLEALNYSYAKCIKAGIKYEYSQEELESFEALTSRFARTSDIFTQKILITLFVLIKENPIGFIDKANLAEKLGIITNSGKLQDIRELRNEIAHEYSSREITEIFKEVLDNIPILQEIIKSARSYIKKTIKEKKDSHP